eukprot:g7342.t1
MTSVQDSPGLTLKVFHVDNSLDGIHCKGRSLGETSFWPDRTVILVPCAECLEAEHFGQSFLETHLLQASAMPNCYMNLLGQGVEIKESSVTTQLGFQEHRICEVLQNDSMYDLSGALSDRLLGESLFRKAWAA